MNIETYRELATTQYTLYTNCQHNCDGMSNCKMFVEGNDKGCLKAYYHYLNLIKKYKEKI